MSEYKPAIAQINLIFSSLESIQNTESLANDPSSKIPTLELISPLAVAQYSLYNTDLEDENFGNDDNIYLVYEGGFLTQENKVNSKKSDFELRGNLTIRQNTSFYNSIDLTNNSIRNVKSKDTRFVEEVYKDTASDSEAMTIGDFRRNSFDKGMIVMWSGSYGELVDQLPNWRLCGRPDSDAGTVNGVNIPNLESFFIVGAAYTGNNTYQPRDNFNATFKTPTTLSIATSGGFNAISLTLAEMASHSHEIQMAVAGGQVNFTPPDIALVSGGGTVSLSLTNAANQCVIFPLSPSCTAGGCEGRSWCSGSWVGCTPVSCSAGAYPIHGGGCTISSGTYKGAYAYGTLTLVDAPLALNTLTEQTIGIDEAHENRPPYYVLGYIINVGKDRTP